MAMNWLLFDFYYRLNLPKIMKIFMPTIIKAFKMNIL